MAGHSDLLKSPRQNVSSKGEIYIFEIPVISGLQICLKKIIFLRYLFKLVNILSERMQEVTVGATAVSNAAPRSNK